VDGMAYVENATMRLDKQNNLQVFLTYIFILYIVKFIKKGYIWTWRNTIIYVFIYKRKRWKTYKYKRV